MKTHVDTHLVFEKHVMAGVTRVGPATVYGTLASSLVLNAEAVVRRERESMTEGERMCIATEAIDVAIAALGIDHPKRAEAVRLLHDLLRKPTSPLRASR